jgi:hypothetical protein
MESGMRVDLTRIQVETVVRHMRDLFDEDEQLRLDTLEGETDLFELARKLLNDIEADEGDKLVLTEQMDTRKVRRDRCDARIKARREAISALMECAGLDKLPLPEATLSLRTMQPKLVVVDPDALPDELCTFTRKPNLTAIRDAEETPPGCALDNGGVSLTIRRK